MTKAGSPPGEDLVEVIETALRSVRIRLGPNALAMLERGEEVTLSGGEYTAMAQEAAYAVVNFQTERWCCNGNMEECVLCTDKNPDYPWICPGHPDNPENRSAVAKGD